MIAFGFVLIAVVDEVARYVHFDLSWAHTHVEEELVEVDVLGADGVSVRVVADEVEFELYDAEHGGLEHVFEEEALLGVEELVVAVFENPVAVDVFDVEVRVEAEPLLVLTLVLHLHRTSLTPFSPRFSSNGSNSSWMFSSSSLIASFQRLL